MSKKEKEEHLIEKIDHSPGKLCALSPGLLWGGFRPTPPSPWGPSPFITYGQFIPD